MFFAATILELNARGDIMSIWMGGNPDAYWLNKKGDLKEKICAMHMPLGILDDDKFVDSARVLTIESDDKLYLYSDGIIEANDITLVELSCQAIAAANPPKQKAIDASALNWNLEISLDVDDMRSPDPVSKITTILNAMPYLSRHKGVLHILLTEIYTNSLDHGILQIESVNKSDEMHFLEYYSSGKTNMPSGEVFTSPVENTVNGYINFSFGFFADDKGKYYLKIHTSDSGQGYTRQASAGTDEMLHGRGLSIIQSFCQKVGISNDGKSLEVLYQL